MKRLLALLIVLCFALPAPACPVARTAGKAVGGTTRVVGKVVHKVLHRRCR